MRKRAKGRKFNREKDQRRALLKSLARSFALKKKIKTTLAKAKELRPFIEKLITRAKKGDLASRRRLTKVLSAEAAKKIIKETAPLFKGRKGGYTRIVKLGPRKSDGAEMAVIELALPKGKSGAEKKKEGEKKEDKN